MLSGLASWKPPVVADQSSLPGAWRVVIKLSNPYKYGAAARYLMRGTEQGDEKGSMADPVRPDRPPLLLCGANRAVLLYSELSNGINQI